MKSNTYEQVQYIASIFRNCIKKQHQTYSHDFDWVKSKNFWVKETPNDIEIAYSSVAIIEIPVRYTKRSSELRHYKKLAVKHLPYSYLHKSDRELATIFRQSERSAKADYLHGEASRTNKLVKELQQQQAEVEKRLADAKLELERQQQKSTDFHRFRNSKNDRIYDWEQGR